MCLSRVRSARLDQRLSSKISTDWINEFLATESGRADFQRATSCWWDLSPFSRGETRCLVWKGNPVSNVIILLRLSVTYPQEEKATEDTHTHTRTYIIPSMHHTATQKLLSLLKCSACGDVIRLLIKGADVCSDFFNRGSDFTFPKGRKTPPTYNKI